MSNKVIIEPTEFKNTRTGIISYGYIIYNDSDRSYDNTLDSIPENDLELLKLVLESNDIVIDELIADVFDCETGLYFGSTYYEFEQIKHII